MRRSLVLLLVVSWAVPSWGLGVGGGMWIDSLNISDTKAFLVQFMEEEMEITVDFALAAYRLALGWHHRFDEGFFAAGLGAGAALTGGGLDLTLASPDPDVQEFLPEIPAGTLTWSAGGPMLWADLELGLPFLRLFGRGNLFLPPFGATGEAGLRAGSLGGAVGLVVRF